MATHKLGEQTYTQQALIMLIGEIFRYSRKDKRKITLLGGLKTRMNKEQLIEKLRIVYEMGKDSDNLKMYEDRDLDDEAEKLMNEMAENIILSFNK
jgi:hypothetical protein